MSDYNNTYSGAAKDAANSIILGADIDTELDNVATMSATKADKVASASVDHIATLDATGNLKDGGIIFSVLEIGDWNMDSVSAISVTHGLTLANIRGVSSVLIRNDQDNEYVPLLYGLSDSSQFTIAINSTTVVIRRLTGGNFDTTSYNSTSYNRGWIILEHV